MDPSERCSVWIALLVACALIACSNLRLAAAVGLSSRVFPSSLPRLTPFPVVNNGFSTGEDLVVFVESPNTSFAFGIYAMAAYNYSFPCLLGVFRQWAQADNTTFKTVWQAAIANVTVCQLIFTADGNLELEGNASYTQIWSTNTSGKGAVSLELRDTGVLVLLNATNGTVWQSSRNASASVFPIPCSTIACSTPNPAPFPWEVAPPPLNLLIPPYSPESVPLPFSAASRNVKQVTIANLLVLFAALSQPMMRMQEQI